MRILLIATESVPYYKTGSLADVVHGLARELDAQEHDVRIAIPCFRGVLRREHMQPIVSSLSVPLGTYAREAIVWKSLHEPPTTYLIEYDFYFGRNEPYGYLDDYERFIFFTRAVVEALSSHEFRTREDNWFPEIIQGYDWAAGLIPGWLHEHRRSGKDSRFEHTRFVLSVNNIESLGIFGTRALRVAKQEETGICDRVDRGKERISFLKRGMMFADKIVVAPPYCGEKVILPGTAKSIEGIVVDRFKAGDLVGIRSAIDYSDYDPSSDARLRKPFNEWTLRDRTQNKLGLQEELGLEKDEDTPLLGMVSRLCSEKGFELFPYLKEAILDSGDVQFVLLADPEDPRYMRMFGDWEQEFLMERGDQLHNWRILYGFEERLARQIYAGSDLFLIPSQQEPGGIQQFIVMHYGAIPVTHKTGILHDSVDQYEPGMELRTRDTQGAGIGFAFTEFTPVAFCEAVQTAVELYRTDRPTWRAIQRHNMRTDFSWFNPAKSYLEVYRGALQTEPAEIKIGASPLRLDRDEQLLQAILEIDSLPGLRRRDSKEMLRQAASLVRDAIQCDAVYVWSVRGGGWSTMIELAAQDMQLVSESLDRSSNPHRPYVSKSPSRLTAVSDLLNLQTSGSWSRSLDLDPSGICKPVLALKDSVLAGEEKWTDGLSVPITAHSRVLGRIDALFVKPIEPNEVGWFTHALTTLASSFGFRLETIRLKIESDQIWETGNELLSAESVTEVVRRILERVHDLLGPDKVELYLLSNNELKSVEPSGMSHSGLEIARSAVETGAVVYVSDSSTVLRAFTEQALLRSFMAAPLVTNLQDRPIGVLVVANGQPASFSRDDERVLVKHLAPQAAIALHVNCLREERERNRSRLLEERDQGRVNQLRELAASLVGGGDFTGLCNRIVNTTAKVLEAQAASLYMLDENTGLLTIQAAAGYHVPLMEVKASYEMGEGTTGWTAETGAIFKADSEEELRAKTPLKGKYRELLESGEPDAFLAVPLKIADRIAGKERVLGVLKVERWRQHTAQSPVAFSDADARLGEIMTNIIATVIYNVKASNDQLQRLSNNLQELSKAMAGGREMRDLVAGVVETMARVLGAEASSLYLIVDTTGRLVIQAATGYQKPLVERTASYDLGEGITGWIASEKKTFRANSRDELSKHVNWKGKQDEHQGGQQPQSFLGMPLKVVDRFTGEERVIGVLKVEDIEPSESHPDRFFNDQDVLLVTMMANIIATVVYNTQVSDAQLRSLSGSLQELSVSLGGGREMRDLVKQIVATMARVLRAKASSLYLVDEAKTELIIQAATGYQKTLVEEGATYALGEGITGWIADKGKPFRANTLADLMNHPNWKGKQDPLQGGLQPKSFLGLPLKVMARSTDREKIIGVLKVEDIQASEDHPEAFFTDQDVLLVTMMANVIATVVYNTQVSNAQLESLSSSLQELSVALAGGREMQDLVAQVVETMARVLGAKASSLYLIDDATGKLVIQAATGYQKPLVERAASYDLGEGITGWIASEKKTFRANSRDELSKHVNWKGKQDEHQAGRQPQSFLGMPLKVVDRFTGEERVIGVLKVEDIEPSESHPEDLFTAQDVLLVTMMANVIATFIHNTRQGEERIGDILQEMGMLSSPVDAASELLGRYARSTNSGIIDQLAIAIASRLGENPEALEGEARTLFAAGANLALYRRIADWAQKDAVKWKFSLFHSILDAGKRLEHWEQVMATAQPWLQLADSSSQVLDFAQAARSLVVELAKVIQAELGDHCSDASSTWFGTIIETSKVFGVEIKQMPVLFLRQGTLDETNVDLMRVFAQRGFKLPHQVVVLVLWDFGASSVQIERMQDRMRIHAIDVVVASIPDILDILEDPNPTDQFRGLVLRQVTTKSPFITVGPVPDTMFFGRARELKEIVQYVGAGRSCVLIGGRRIGKSSVLSRLHRVRLPEVGFRTLLFDSATVNSYEDFLAKRPRGWRPSPPPSAPDTFRDVLGSTPVDEQPLVLLLDEADKLVVFDQENDWQLFKQLRALSYSGRAQIVLSGERVLREVLRDPGSPLFNFANEILLGPLSFSDVDALVTRPFEQLQIELRDERAIVNNIYAFTSGHPNVVQRLCRRLVDLLNAQRSRRITAESVDLVINDPGFQRDDFLSTYWEAATPLEKIISLLMADDREVYTLSALQQTLGRRCGLYLKAREVDEGLQRLVDLRSILKRTSTGYAFAVEAFPRVVSGTVTLKDMLKVLSEEFQEQGE